MKPWATRVTTRSRIIARLADRPATNRALQDMLGMDGLTVAKRVWALTNSGAVLSHTRGPGLPATYSLSINLLPPERRFSTRAEQMTNDERGALILRLEGLASAKERDVPKLVKDRLPGHAARVKGEAEDIRAAVAELTRIAA